MRNDLHGATKSVVNNLRAAIFAVLDDHDEIHEPCLLSSACNNDVATNGFYVRSYRCEGQKSRGPGLRDDRIQSEKM